MRGVKQEIDWQRHDELLAQGVTSGRERARRLGIPDAVLRRAVTRREQEAEGTPRVPMRVPQETQIPTTATPATPATISDLQQLFERYESRLKAYVEQRIQEAIQQGGPLELPPQHLQLPMGTPVPEYPDDPQKDTRLNLHVSAGESWEIHTIAAAFGMTPSRLIRRVWEMFRETPQAKQALHQMLNSQGTREEKG